RRHEPPVQQQEVAEQQRQQQQADRRDAAVARRELQEPAHDLPIARVALPWSSDSGAWRSACPAGRSSRALPHGGHGKATRRAGSVCPHPCVITRSWTDVHSLLLPWPARKQLPARVTRRHGTGSRLARIHARPSASARHFAAWLPTRRVILPDSLLSRGAMLLAAAG